MKFLFFIALAVLAACDSPRNHRVHEESAGAVVSTSAVKEFSKAGFKLRYQWVMGPFNNLQKASVLMVYLYDQNGQLATLPADREINFFASMPDMGHAIDDVGFFEMISPGIYMNSTIHFNMAGPWQLELWLQNSDFDILDKVIWSETL